MTTQQLPAALGQPNADAVAARRRTIIIVVIIGVLLAGGGWWIGRATANPENPTSGAGLGSAHGPTLITNGIPHGYTRDATGAATAAINALQVIGSVTVRKIDAPAAEATVLATTADDHAKHYFIPGVSNTILNLLYSPLSFGVTTYTPDAATVRIWAVSVGATTTVDGFIPLYGFLTVEVIWEAGDWKIRSIEETRNDKPLAVDFDDVPPWTGGAFTFLTQEGQ